ncbi:MAG: tyrosine-type recombinase/integrase [Planctomycetota bacterium]|jgi:integrase/recombinase XerC
MGSNRALTADAAEESVFIEDYLNWLNDQKSRSASTLDSYRKDLLQLSGQLSGCFGSNGGLPEIPSQLTLPVAGLDEIFQVVTPQVAQNYVDWLMDQRFSCSTVNRKITSIRGFYKYLKGLGRINSSPFADVYVPQNDSAGPEYLEEKQLGELFNAIGCNGWLGYRDRAITALLYNTGMRVSELLELTVDDFDEVQGGVKIHSKGRKRRVCKLWGWVQEAVVQYLAHRRQREACEPLQTNNMFINRDSGPLTSRSVRRKLKMYSRQAGLSLEATPAILRHSCAMHMLQHGASDRVVRSQLGHQSSSSIRPYLKLMKAQNMSRGQSITAVDLEIVLNQQ